MVSQLDQPAGGFHGETAGMQLVDLLQLWSMNRFSGLVEVTYLGHKGHLYFLEGEVVHAEAGGAVGEPAVGAILAWPGGTFDPFPNTTTLKRTIQKRLSHLLLDAHRVIDEQRRAPVLAAPPPSRRPPSGRPPPPWIGSAPSRA